MTAVSLISIPRVYQIFIQQVLAPLVNLVMTLGDFFKSGTSIGASRFLKYQFIALQSNT